MAISSEALQECKERSTTRARSPDRTVKPHERAAIKRCVKCETEKPETEFDWATKSRRSKCKRCRQDEANERYSQNPERKRSQVYRWREDNPDKKVQIDAKSYQKRRPRILAQKSEYHSLNRDAINESKAEYRARPGVRQRYREYNKKYYPEHYRRNKAYYLAKFIARRELKRRAMPAWADRQAIARLYEMARRKTRETGIPHEVDHIIPLQGKNVCGLHVETNLRVITRKNNRAKRNKLIEDIV